MHKGARTAPFSALPCMPENLLRAELLTASENYRAAINLQTGVFRFDGRNEDSRFKGALLEQFDFVLVWNRHIGAN